MRFFPSRQPILIVAALALAACHHPQPAAREPRAPAPATIDPGVAVLAAVQNARAAIAAGDRLAAFNSVAVALSDASQLTGSDSAIFPPEAAPPGYRPPGGYGGGSGPGGGGRGHRRAGHRAAAAGEPAGLAPPNPAPPGPAPTNAASAPVASSDAAPAHRHRGAAAAANGQTEISGFDAQVRLTSINAQLQSGDVTGADAGLQALEAAAATHPAPPDLPLVRADQSLTLASTAANSGRIGELRTLLQTARAALLAYGGRPHAAEARALANAIGAALDHPGGVGALAPIELSLWSGRLSSWT